MEEIKYGDFKAIKVFDNDDSVIVQLPKFCPKVDELFKGKVQGGFYASFFNGGDVVAEDKTYLRIISKNLLRSDEQIKDFNSKISQSVIIHDNIQQDFATMHDIVKFDLSEKNAQGEDKKVIFKYGQDKHKETGELKKWAFGDVLAKNENYVAISAGGTNDANFARILPTEIFILSKEEELRASQILGDRLKVGEHVRLTWKNEQGKPTKIEVEPAIKKELKAEVAEAAKQAIQEVAEEKKEVAVEKEQGAKPVKRSRKKVEMSA